MCASRTCSLSPKRRLRRKAPRFRALTASRAKDLPAKGTGRDLNSELAAFLRRLDADDNDAKANFRQLWFTEIDLPAGGWIYFYVGN